MSKLLILISGQNGVYFQVHVTHILYVYALNIRKNKMLIKATNANFTCKDVLARMYLWSM